MQQGTWACAIGNIWSNISYRIAIYLCPGSGQGLTYYFNLSKALVVTEMCNSVNHLGNIAF